MPIVRFTTNEANVPEGAVNVNHYMEGSTPVWTWDIHTGYCLEDRERNGRDDSDFYMTY